METAVCVSGFLLLVFITGVHLSPDLDPGSFVAEGGSFEFSPSALTDYFVEYSVLYRVFADGDLLLANCSQPDRPPKEGYDVACHRRKVNLLKNLSLSQSGDYRVEEWREGVVTGNTSHRVTVCAECDEKPSHVRLRYDDSAVLCRPDSTLGNSSSLQLYRSEVKVTLVLDTNSSLEPLVDDLRGRLQVDLNNSQVTLSGAIEADSKDAYVEYHCVTWSGAQCQSFSKRTLRIFPKYVFTHQEKNVTLPCTSRGEPSGQVRWSTPTEDVQLTSDQTHQQEVMYMLNGSQTGDYSLIIPSVSQQHSGGYVCEGRDPYIKNMYLYVCTIGSPLDVMFSHSESVRLDVTPHLRFSDGGVIQWYRQRVLEPKILILDPFYGSELLPEDLRSRVTVSKIGTNHSLTISNLTAEDSGLYTWRVFGGEENGDEDEYEDEYSFICLEGSIRLVYRDPFGVHSPFYRVYAPLMGCALLGLVTAVIWFNLRSRRGEQTSGRQSREGHQSGDEDIYYNVEMAEGSV